MESLSFSFLQRNSINQSLAPNPPLPSLKFRISSVKIDERYDTIQKQNRVAHIVTRRRKLKITPPPTEQETDQDRTLGRKNNSFLTKFFNALDDFICDFMDPDPLPPYINPKHVLAGNFAPVTELQPTPCPAVEGSLPPSLHGGAYIRNGPNPQFFPRGPYHLFDGDGMLHALTISGGGATLCSRFVKTYKYNLERESGSPVILNVFSAFDDPVSSLARCAVMVLRFLAGIYDPHRGVGGANTSLALFAGKLFALNESDLPYRVKLNSDGDVITLGRQDSFGEAFMTMTAHPKIDPNSGEAFAFRYSIRRPFLTYFRISKDGIKQPEVPIFSLKHCSLIHDFAITENYVVFPETQILIRPEEILRGRPPVKVDPAKKQRMGIMPRYAADDGEMWWVEVAGLNMVHATNAWEEDGGETVVVVGANVSAAEHFLERVDLCRPLLEIIEINVKTKNVRSRRLLCGECLDFAVINPAYVGKKSRYVYASVGVPMPKIGGVAKIDLSLSAADSGDCTVATHLYPPGVYGGEPCFVAKEPHNPEAEEDDGYLVTYVHDENSNESKFLVMDAKSPNLDIIASVKLPQRVPYGFHGIFVPASDLKNL